MIKNLTTRRVYREWGEIRQAGRSILLLVTSFELIYRESPENSGLCSASERNTKVKPLCVSAKLRKIMSVLLSSVKCPCEE